MGNNYYRIKAVLEFDKDQQKVIKRFGKSSSGNIERTFSVNGYMPLYALHYALIKAFGFLNEHLHCFKLYEEDFHLLTATSEMWRNNVGKWFKSPTRDENEDFWCDDYQKGSFQNWLRKKYTMPYVMYSGQYPNYQSWQKNLNFAININNDEFVLFEKGNEKMHYLIPIPYDDAVEDGLYFHREDIIHFKDIPMECLQHLFRQDIDELLDTITIEEIYQAFKRMKYFYDYGDNWEINIFIEREEDKDIIYQFEEYRRPVMVSYEGYNMVEDVGSYSGYVRFLLSLFNLKEVNAEDVNDVIKLEAGGHFYQLIDERYPLDYLDLSVKQTYSWAHNLEWDYMTPEIKKWF